jgi:glycosyltransferase involved in cell wall biosynthesis
MDSSTPFVSIIIPTYNRDAFIQETVESALAQTWPAKEVIVVDDGSTDRTPEILSAFGERIRLIRQENRGVGTARNRAIQASRGEYFVFLDSDDLLLPNFLEVMVPTLRARPQVDILYCWWCFINEKGELLPEKGAYTGQGNLFLQTVVSNRLPIMTVLLPRRCVEAVGGFHPDPLVSEDWDFFLKITQRGYIFDYTPTVLVKYRFHGTNVTLNVSRSLTRYLNALDILYRRSDLPAAALALKDRAYGEVYLTTALYSWAQFDYESARSYLNEGVRRWPELICQEETYYRLACAQQPPGYRDTPLLKDLPEMERQIDAWLEAMFADPELAPQVAGLRQRAYAVRRLALARQYYQLGDEAQARRLLKALIAATPTALLRREVSGLWLRSLIGRRRILKMKQLIPGQRPA